MKPKKAKPKRRRVPTALDRDKKALVACWRALGGDEQHLRNFTNDVRDWDGVLVEGNRVVGIFWHRRGFSRQIPSRIRDLTALQYLSLSENEIHGALPPALSELENLKDLWLDSNKLSGVIPSSLSKPKKLECLSLHSNEFRTEVPEADIYDDKALVQSYLFSLEGRKRIAWVDDDFVTNY